MISEPTLNTPPISAQPGQAQSATPSGGWFFWKFLALLELLLAYLSYSKNSQSKRLPTFFLLAFAGSCLVIYGEFKELFQWAVAGIPIAAYFFFLMSQGARTERSSAFLMVICAILSLTFVYLLFKTLGLIVTIEKALQDYIGLSINILFIFALLFGGLTIYKKKFSFLVIALLFLGFWSYDNPQIKSMFNTLKPTIPDKITTTFENVTDSVLRGINNAVAPTPPTTTPPPRTQTPASTPAPTPTSATAVSKPAPASQRVPVAKRVTPQSVTATTGKVSQYIIPANGAPPYCQIIQVGEWRVYHPGTRIRNLLETGTRIIGEDLLVLEETTQCFYPPTGAREIRLTRK
jgi:hypothetical protein